MSDYGLFVFVMPLSEIKQLLGGLSRRYVPQEIMCEGDVCGEVTKAIYLTPEEVANGGFLVDRLLEGIGLDPFREPAATE